MIWTISCWWWNGQKSMVVQCAASNIRLTNCTQRDWWARWARLQIIVVEGEMPYVTAVDLSSTAVFVVCISYNSESQASSCQVPGHEMCGNMIPITTE
jgi:hypothetical protein